MDIRRIVLYAALAVVSYSLWTHWQLDYPPQSLLSHPTSIVDTTSDRPVLSTNNMSHDNETPNDVPKLIQVKTDVLNLSIDLKQGNIVSAELLDYPESVENKEKPFSLLQNTQEERYVANSSLFVVNGQKTENADAYYETDKSSYQLSQDQDNLTVTLTGKNSDGLLINKQFIFTKGSYLIQVRYTVQNESDTDWQGYMNTELLRNSPKEDKSSIFHVGSYTGASYSYPGVSKYKKVNFNQMAKANLDVNAKGGWVAMQQHYFLSAWIPVENSSNTFYTRALGGDYTIGAVSHPIVIKPQQKESIGAQLYLGPEITDVLKSIAPGLDLTVDYGWLWFLSSLLFSLMKSIYSFVGNWGLSIILVTLLIKLAFFRLSATSYKSMASMRKLQPKLLALRERYGDDKAKISQATMELYKQEKVNPLGGCLPIVIQIPVFIALYWVLLESVQLRQAPFVFWIHDLAMPDPYHILPVIMGMTMLIQQKLNPAPPDPMQAKVMMFLPIVFTGLFWNFPSGLVLYWIVNNSLSILQQWYITRKYSDNKPALK